MNLALKTAFVFISLLSLTTIQALPGVPQRPVVGAQVFIEPGQSDESIERWFEILHENNMPVCRIRMFEEYMRTADGEWDFTLFDKAFRAAEKYNIKIFATLFPAAPNNSVGGFKFPLSDEHAVWISGYIEKVVPHFNSFGSLYAWVLLNEPGVNGVLPVTEFTMHKMQEWKREQGEPAYRSKGYNIRLTDFTAQRFLLDCNTGYLAWLAQQVTVHDPGRHIHVNSHQIFNNIAEYDFPAWRGFLSSLGASAHPSWHFNYFERNRYVAALAANCNIVRSGAGDLPFWVTELQGGNNTYSAVRAFCPTAQETTQWLWTSIASGADGIIFWCLNPRAIGEEAGEWALLDFRNKPSDRLKASVSVSRCLNDYDKLFGALKPVGSPVTIIYTRESLWCEKKVQHGLSGDPDYEGRQPGGVIKSAISFYETLLDMGINTNFREIHEYDWSRNDYAGQMIILAGQTSIPSGQWANLRRFVRGGGKLFVEGLSSFFDENMLSLYTTGFPLEDVFGGTLAEVICEPGDFTVASGQGAMPAHLWKGFIDNVSGEVLLREKGKVMATRHRFGRGETLWIPSMIGLGARRTGDNSALTALLAEEIKDLRGISVKFAGVEQRVSMFCMQDGSRYLTVLINKSGKIRQVLLDTAFNLSPRVIFSDGKGTVENKKIMINPEETLVVLWE